MACEALQVLVFAPSTTWDIRILSLLPQPAKFFPTWSFCTRCSFFQEQSLCPPSNVGSSFFDQIWAQTSLFRHHFWLISIINLLPWLIFFWAFTVVWVYYMCLSTHPLWMQVRLLHWNLTSVEQEFSLKHCIPEPRKYGAQQISINIGEITVWWYQADFMILNFTRKNPLPL